jgi:hypothetical protein
MLFVICSPVAASREAKNEAGLAGGIRREGPGFCVRAIMQVVPDQANVQHGLARLSHAAQCPLLPLVV